MKTHLVLNSFCFCGFFSPVTRPWLRRSAQCRDSLGEQRRMASPRAGRLLDERRGISVCYLVFLQHCC